MDRSEIAAELGAPGAQELLASTSAAHLAYTAKDGTPRVIPVGYFWTGAEFCRFRSNSEQFLPVEM